MNRRQYISETIVASAGRRNLTVAETDRIKRAMSHARYWQWMFRILLALALLFIGVGVWLALTVP